MDKLVENYFFTQINIYMPIWIRPMHALTNIMFNSHTTVHKCIVNGLEYSIQSDTVVIYTSVGDVVAVYPISTWTRVQLFQCSCKYWHRFFYCVQQNIIFLILWVWISPFVGFSMSWLSCSIVSYLLLQNDQIIYQRDLNTVAVYL